MVTFCPRVCVTVAVTDARASSSKGIIVKTIVPIKLIVKLIIRTKRAPRAGSDLVESCVVQTWLMPSCSHGSTKNNTASAACVERRMTCTFDTRSSCRVPTSPFTGCECCVRSCLVWACFCNLIKICRSFFVVFSYGN